MGYSITIQVGYAVWPQTVRSGRTKSLHSNYSKRSNRPFTPASGTFRTWHDVSLESAFGDKAENICSSRVFPSLTRCGHFLLTPK